MADCQVSKTAGQVLSAYALGSCIGLSVHDPRATVGGLLHYMLPDSAIDAGRSGARPYMFADTGIPKLLDEVCGHGALRRRLVAHAVGGAQMINDSMTFDIGKRNCLALRKVLWKFGVLLAGEVLGGGSSRTMRLEIGSGRVWLLEQGAEKELAPALGMKGGMAWPTGS
jgi:chemotaxis protein CheD